MLARLRQELKTLRAGTPGHRFRARYDRHQRSEESQRWLHRAGRLLGAAVAFVVGVVLVFIPGPAIVFFALAGALLASDWLWVARLLDWSEVKLRRVWEWARRFWQQLPGAGRVALLVVGAGLAAAAACLAYRLLN